MLVNLKMVEPAPATALRFLELWRSFGFPPLFFRKNRQKLKIESADLEDTLSFGTKQSAAIKLTGEGELTVEMYFSNPQWKLRQRNFFYIRSSADWFLNSAHIGIAEYIKNFLCHLNDTFWIRNGLLDSEAIIHDEDVWAIGEQIAMKRKQSDWPYMPGCLFFLPAEAQSVAMEKSVSLVCRNKDTGTALLAMATTPVDFSNHKKAALRLSALFLKG